MIEFDGYINGAAEKRYQRNNRVLLLKVLIFAEFMVAPSIMIWGIKRENWLMVGLVGAALIIWPLLFLVPQGKKTRKATTPKNITIDKEFLTAKTDGDGHTKHINDVKQVVDHGEFYEIIFPFGKMSTYFICQKNLLKKGTLQQFEDLFKEKLTRRQKR